MPDRHGQLCPEETSIFRRPHWRWRWARRIRTGRAAYDSDVDVDVLHFVRLFREIRLAQTAQASEAISATAQALTDALAIWKAGGPARWELESWLLTGESDSRIAERCRLPLATVAAYEQAFFHVRDRLQCDGWIFIQAVGRIRPREDGPFDIGPLWRAAAYLGGPHALEAFIAESGDRDQPDWPFAEQPGETSVARSIRLLCSVMLLQPTATTRDVLDLVPPSFKSRSRRRCAPLPVPRPISLKSPQFSP